GVSGSDDDVAAVVFFGPVSPSQTLPLHWNGSAWSVVPSPNPDTNDNALFAVGGSGNDVWAVGLHSGNDDIDHTLTLHWNGSIWSQVASPDDNTGNRSLAVSGSGNDACAVAASQFTVTAAS